MSTEYSKEYYKECEAAHYSLIRRFSQQEYQAYCKLKAANLIDLAHLKRGQADIEKAVWYLNKLIEGMEE